jgi:hypothetical protein
MVDWSNLDLEDVVQESYHLEYASKVGSLFVDLAVALVAPATIR